MEFFVKDKSFYKRAAVIAIPVTLQTMITMGVNMADQIMVGKLGTPSLSAVNAANKFIGIFQICCMGIGMGASVLTARFWGMKDLTSLKKAITVMLRLCLGFALLFMIPTIFRPDLLMKIYVHPETMETADKVAEALKTIELGPLYYKWMIPCYILQGMALTCTIVLRSVGQVKIPLYSSIGAFFVNIFFTWVFIFGKLGAPAMGIEGAGLGTVIARGFEFCFICGYFFVLDQKIKYRLKDILSKCGDIIGTYISISLPVLISDGLLAFGETAVTIVMGLIDTQFLAADGMTATTQRMTTVFIQGICHAGCIMTGHTLGEGDRERAQREAWTFASLGAVIGAIAGVIILVISEPVISIFDVDESTKALAREMMKAISLIVLFQSMNSILTKGVLRGGGDTKFLMVADILFLWIASVPLGYCAGMIWGMTPFWIYFFLKIDQVIKAVWCVGRLKSGKWIKAIANEGVQAESKEA